MINMLIQKSEGPQDELFPAVISQSGTKNNFDYLGFIMFKIYASELKYVHISSYLSLKRYYWTDFLPFYPKIIHNHCMFLDSGGDRISSFKLSKQHSEQTKASKMVPYHLNSKVWPRCWWLTDTITIRVALPFQMNLNRTVKSSSLRLDANSSPTYHAKCYIIHIRRFRRL